MSFEHTEKQILFAPRSPDYEGQGNITPKQLHRWMVMGAIALALLGVVIYMYQTKVGMPVEQLESDIEPQVITQPALCGSRMCNEAN